MELLLLLLLVSGGAGSVSSSQPTATRSREATGGSGWRRRRAVSCLRLLQLAGALLGGASGMLGVGGRWAAKGKSNRAAEPNRAVDTRALGGRAAARPERAVDDRCSVGWWPGAQCKWTSGAGKKGPNSLGQACVVAWAPPSLPKQSLNSQRALQTVLASQGEPASERALCTQAPAPLRSRGDRRYRLASSI